jgi:uncharacterized SAM-binding protein YcdF (DUF218 family)
MKKQVGFFIFLFGLIGILLSSISITGAAIGVLSGSIISIFYLIFILAGALIVLEKERLDAIVIPTGGKENHRRAARAYQAYLFEENPDLIITGDLMDSSHFDLNSKELRFNKSEQIKEIIDQLSSYGANKDKIIVDGSSKNTLENFLHTSQLAQKRGLKSIGIATDDDQYKRFEMFERRAKEKGLIPREMHFYQLPVEDSQKLVMEKIRDKIYGTLAYLKDRHKTKGGLPIGARSKKVSENKYIEAVKHALWS